MRLDLRVIDLGAAETFLTHQIGSGKTLADIAELVMNVTFNVAGLVIVQKHGVRRARRFGRIIGGQLLRLEFDQCESPLGRLLIDRGHRRHRLAAIAHAATGEGIFVHGDREYAVGVRAVVAGHNCDHAIQRPGLAYIEPDDVGMAERAAEDASNESVAVVKIRRIAGLAGHLFDAVNERNARTFREVCLIRSCRHDVNSAAACTNSMIFT